MTLNTLPGELSSTGVGFEVGAGEVSGGLRPVVLSEGRAVVVTVVLAVPPEGWVGVAAMMAAVMLEETVVASAVVVVMFGDTTGAAVVVSGGKVVANGDKGGLCYCVEVRGLLYSK